MKLKVMPFTCIKLHFFGEIFEPVTFYTKFKLQSENSELVGSNGNAYEFVTFESAMAWIENNLIRASKKQLTSNVHVEQLVLKNSINAHDYLIKEIETITNKNNGDWFDYSNSNITAIDGGNASTNY